MGIGTVYTVEVDITTKGDLPSSMGRIGGELDRVDRKAQSLGATFYRLGGKVSDGFTGVVESVGGKLSGLAKLGVASAIGAATYGVTSLNKELETTTISLAAVLNKEGLTTSIEGGMQRASAWVAQMKRDAKDLPGEFQDLLGIVQSSAGAAFQAGLDDQGLEKLASQTMAAAKALAIDMPQAGRDLGRLLGGSAGMDNMLGSRLGFTADNFNTKDRAEQVKMITAELAKFQPAIAVFGQTFDAQSSTLMDNLKSFATVGTKELFGRVTSTLGDINAWFDANQDDVRFYAEKTGQILANAWDDGKRFVQEWGPSILGFADRFYDKFIAVWRDAEPYVKSIAGAVKGFLDSPDSMDHISTTLQLYAGIRALGMGKSALGLLGLGGGAAGGAAGGSSVLAGLFGGGKAAAAVAPEVAEWLALTKAATLTGKAGSMLTGAGQAVGAAGVGTVGLLGAVGLGVGGAIGATGYEIYDARRRGETVDARGGGAYGYSEGAQIFVNEMVDKGIKAGEAMGKVEDATLPTIAGFSEAGDAASEFAHIIRSLAASGDFAAIAQINAGLMAKQQGEGFASDESARNTDFFRLNGAAMGIAAIKALDDQDARAKALAKKQAAAKGSGNVNIARVEITVSSNQAPGQIARDVAKELVDMRRYRKSSPSAQNFSAGR